MSENVNFTLSNKDIDKLKELGYDTCNLSQTAMIIVKEAIRKEYVYRDKIDGLVDTNIIRKSNTTYDTTNSKDAIREIRREDYIKDGIKEIKREDYIKETRKEVEIPKFINTAKKFINTDKPS